MNANNTVINTTMEWQGRTIRLTYDPDTYEIVDHLVIQAEDGLPLPITETGYRSHFFGPMKPSLTASEIKTLVCEWLDHEAKSSDWQKYEAEHKQLSLF
ncbi:hypothetical protein [Hyphococcus sp.]|uniref:hypothetical protein n=1 Tax=Hyphococcus sp. TaxID=2038636 RepID=UPI0035C780FA